MGHFPSQWDYGAWPLAFPITACYTAAHDKLKKHNATLRVHEFDMFIHHYAYLMYVQNVHVCTVQYSVILRTKFTSPYCIVC